jgi:hypothetical protein
MELIKKEKTRGLIDVVNKLELKERMICNLIDGLGLSLEKGVGYCKEKKSYIFSKNQTDCKKIAVTCHFV